MTALLILACSATKVATGITLPALERYDGPAWRVLRKAVRERPGLAERLDVRALSAEYGLIPATTPIRYYDRRMTRARAAELRGDVALAVWRIPGPYNRVAINVGEAYRLALPDKLPWRSPLWIAGSIGERLQQLRGWLWTL